MSEPSRDFMSAFVDGELSGEEQQRALTLLESDPAFQRGVCELRALKEQVRGAYPLPPVRQTEARFGHGLQALAAGLLLSLGLIGGWAARDKAYPSITPAGLPLEYRAVALHQRVDPDKVILHLDSGEIPRLHAALDLAERLLAERGGRGRVEIVANSYGLDLLRADITPLGERIDRLAARHANLAFVACGQTMARLKREGVKVELLPVARPASSAINEIMTRMGEGWVYVKV